MANEFIARKGLIVPSGSILVTSGSVTALNFIGTASAAVSSSHAVTASFALNAAGSGFPFSGSAVITGSLNVTQGVTASYFKGDGSQLTNLPASQANSALRIDNHLYEADGITTDYILSQSYYTADSIVVSVGGIAYAPILDYTVSSSTLSFLEAPPSSSNIIARAFVAVSSGSINILSGSFIGNLTGTSSFALTASYVSGAASNWDTLVNKPSGLVSSSTQILNYNVFATTGSNTFVGTQTFSGSINFQSGSSISPDLQDLEIKPGVGGDLLLFNNNSVHSVRINDSGVTITDLNVLNGITGSLQGTASYANNADLFDGKDSTTFATTGSNTFTATQTIAGNIFLSASFPLVYNNNSANNMLFGFFDGSTIHGAYYQTFGNTYPSLSQRGGAEFVYDVRNNSDANFHVASFNGSTWTEKFRVDDTGIIVTGSIKSTGGVTGSLLGTSSWAENAITASYALNAQSGGTGAGFPFSGSAVITGSLYVVPTGNFNGITGSFSGSGAGLTDLRGSLAIDTYNFVGNGSTTEYYLSQSYTANSLIVTVEGMTNIVDGDFTLSGPTMSFAVAPPSQSNVLVKAFLVASSGSYATYTGSFVGDGSGLTKLPVNFNIQRQTFVGNGVTQNYILSQSYVPSGIVVTVGGLRYVDTNDYSLSGNTVQFVQAPASNSIIVVDAFVNASSGSVGIFSGSFIGTASFATTASFANNVLKTKAGSITNTLFGGTPLTASVTFSTSFPNTNFAVVVTGEDARSWTIESKTAGGFTVNSNSNTALTGTTYWTCTAYGEN